MYSLKGNFTLILFLLISILAQAQPRSISGTVRSNNGTPVKQAIIWVSDLDSTFFSDNQGNFNIPASGEKHFLKIAAKGYSSKTIALPYNFHEKLLIYLDQTVSDEYFNPYEKIRLAKIRRADNQRKYTSYKAKTFKTSAANLLNVPFQLPIASGLVLPAKGDTGIMFYSEQLSKHHFQSAYSFEDSVIAYRAAGTLAAPDFNYVSDKGLSFYNESLSLPELDIKQYHSPLGEKALRVYDFKALGTYMDGDRKVYRIQFTPKRYGSAAITGYMELYDSTYTIAYTRYKFSNSHHLETLDSINVEQYYFYQDNEYRQVYTNLNFHLNITGFKGFYTSSTYFIDHKFETSPPQPELGTEVYHLDSSSISNNSEIWNNQIPVQASPQAQSLLETNNLNTLFREKYSRNLHFHRDFNLKNLFYKRYVYREGELYVNFPPLYYLPSYNTVEGLALSYKVPVRIYKPSTEWLITPMARYGFADQEFKSRVSTEFTYDLENPKKVKLEVGHVLDQFNPEEPIHHLINSFYSLFLSENYMKLYGKDYIKAGYQLELTHGLEFQSSLEYADRYPVYNNTDFAFIGGGNDFTPNNPVAGDVIDEDGFKNHLALTFRAQLAYQFHQRYKTINGKKVNLQMRTPRIYLNYRQGIASGFSDTRFAFASAGITFNTDWKSFGSTRWDFSSGGFIDRSKVEFIDYQHFNGTQTFYLQPTSYYYHPIKQFSTLGYYDYSTDKGFIEAHMQHHFDGALLSRIGFLRNTGIHTFAGLNYLYNFEQPQFAEFYIGIDNILDILKVEVATPINHINDVRPTILIGIDFNYLYYLRNKK